MIYKILVALDYSDRNESVFNSAISLAKSTGADLMLLHVLAEKEPGYPIIPSYTYYPILDDYDYNLYQQKIAEYKQQGIDFLQGKAKEAKTAGVNAEFIQLSGHPGRSICELATTWSADVIMVGSRGLQGLKEMFLGSISNYVTHHAPCSVLIVRNALDPESDAAAEDEDEDSSAVDNSTTSISDA